MRQLGARADGADDEARPVGGGDGSEASRAISAAARLSSKARSARPNSARTILLAPKVLVSTASQPTSRKARGSSMTSGRVWARISVQFSRPG